MTQMSGHQFLWQNGTIVDLIGLIGIYKHL